MLPYLLSKYECIVTDMVIYPHMEGLSWLTLYLYKSANNIALCLLPVGATCAICLDQEHLICRLTADYDLDIMPMVTPTKSENATKSLGSTLFTQLIECLPSNSRHVHIGVMESLIQFCSILKLLWRWSYPCFLVHPQIPLDCQNIASPKGMVYLSILRQPMSRCWAFLC